MTTKRKKLTKAEQAVRAAKRKARAILNARSPQEWRSAIKTIKGRSCRVQAACIVWWDYFAHREVSDRWPHLDKYVKAWTVRIRVPQAQLEAALLSIGYLPEDAARRSTMPTSQSRSASGKGEVMT